MIWLIGGKYDSGIVFHFYRDSSDHGQSDCVTQTRQDCKTYFLK